MQMVNIDIAAWDTANAKRIKEDFSNARPENLACHFDNLSLLPAIIVQGQNKGFQTPPAPALSARDEMETFKIKPGYRVQLVAAEPLVHDPVAMTFDPDGRIWVCEMRGFMPDVDGKGQKDPVGTISVLEDTDGDGIMDKSTVFLDKLVLPRSLCWTTDGLLVAGERQYLALPHQGSEVQPTRSCSSITIPATPSIRSTA